MRLLPLGLVAAQSEYYFQHWCGAYYLPMLDDANCAKEGLDELLLLLKLKPYNNYFWKIIQRIDLRASDSRNWFILAPPTLN